MLSIKEYQERCRETAIYPNQGNNLYYPALGLGEAGEVQNVVKKIMRDHNGEATAEDKLNLRKELGDLMWYVATLATEAGLDLEVIMVANLEKLASRKQRGVIQGNGDNR